MADIIVIGAGHIGLACAYYLQRDGHDVTVIDRGNIGGACSKANCGFIVPSHVLPLTRPEALLDGVKSLFQPRAAFRVKPQLRPDLLRWMLEFGRRCNHRQMLEAGNVLHSLLDASAKEYQDIVANLDCEWKGNGLMLVYRSPQALDEFAKTDTLLTSEFGLSARLMSGEELAAFEPALLDDLAGAWLYEDDSHLRPDKLNAAWSTHLQEQGTELVEDCHVDAVETCDGKVTGLDTSQGRMEADRYVFATGAWSSRFADALGCEIPVEPGKGYSVTMTKPDVMPQHPMLIPEMHIGVTPFDDGYRIASMMEFAGFDDSIPEFRIQQLQDSAVPYLREPIGPVVQDRWYGWRPMTWDSLPIIGRVPALSNALLATGHNMLGLSLAPITGKLIADFVSERPASTLVQAVSPDRFS